ncbi:YqjF family protein [Arthrobacter sp. GCM10027362]|uniref:YqjF family protein n=1 Tax=Arthrobacter sp. GCM10027362 TaxID=3273379 RepID=UPI0036410EAF
MQPHRFGDAGGGAAGPELPRPLLLAQSWSDAVFLHWRISASAAAPYMPAGVEPDLFEGSTWVGLIGFRVHGTHLAAALPLPYAGSFTEVNVRLYSRGSDGTRGVVFLSLDASRLAFVLAARAAGLRYVWSRCRPALTRDPAPGYGYDVDRYRGQAASSFAVRPDLAREAGDRLSLWLTARFGLHSRFAGRTVYLPNSHRPWPLHPAALTRLEDALVAAAGIAVGGPPESVLFSPGVRTRFGRPSILRRP